MKSKIFAAHQPNFLPYLGFFDKIKKSDIFVIMDDAMFANRDFHHRNKIRIGSKQNPLPRSKWLTVPINNPHDYIKFTTIKKDTEIEKRPWNIKMLDDIYENYRNTKHFNEFFPEIKSILDNSDTHLLSLNLKLIKFFMKAFNIDTQLIISSDLKLKSEHYEKSDPCEYFIKLAKSLNVDTYLSGPWGINYIDKPAFNKQNLDVEFQHFEHPTYEQAFPGFLPYMSALDALLCIGKMPEIEEKMLISS